MNLDSLRHDHPTFTVAEPVVSAEGDRLVLRFPLTAGKHAFEPSVSLHGLTPDEMSRATSEPARRLIRALAVVESFSYWKAFCSPELAIPAGDDLGWWNAFWPHAMGEFFYRNQIDFTTPDFLNLTADPAPEETTGNGNTEHDRALVLFSGGKDSLALVLTVRRAMPVDFFLYNPTPGQLDLTESLKGPDSRVFTVKRAILPELLELNAAGHPNGHTPYSAYLAFAAMLTGLLGGNQLVLAGNARSDDEPNVSAYLGRPINHQWTKTYEFESALREYRHRWVPQAPLYASPLRPLFELQVISLLKADVDAYLRTASCNKMKSQGWCGSCAKCAWVFMATSAVFGRDTAIAKLGRDLYDDLTLAGLYERMAGLHGTKPFECTGSEDEVRAAIQEALRQETTPKALLAAAEDVRIREARPLTEVLGDWGADDLVPGPLRALVEEARRTPHHG